MAAEFRSTPLHFDEEDARYFVMAWDEGFLEHVGSGRYVAPRNAACEKFFNAGAAAVVPRNFTLAQEALITVGVLARLHFEFGWPRDLLGTQSPMT